MSTLAQIEALKQEITELSGKLADIENGARLAKQSLQSAKRKSRYYRCAQALRKPANEYSLWHTGVLVVGPTIAIAVVFVFLTILSAPAGLILFLSIFAALTALSALYVLLSYPATSLLPSLITDQLSIANELQVEVDSLADQAAVLRNKISVTKSAIKELLESDRLKRELLLKQNWKAMRGIEWEQYLVQVFDALGASAETTRTTGDQGVDLLVRFGQMMIAVQAKGYVGSVGNDAVQQAVAGRVHYGCDRAAVITNSRFTAPARALAASNRCFLIGEQEFPAFVLGSNLELFR